MDLKNRCRVSFPRAAVAQKSVGSAALDDVNRSKNMHAKKDESDKETFRLSVALKALDQSTSDRTGWAGYREDARESKSDKKTPSRYSAVEMMQSSMAEDASPRDDPWIILEEITTWVVRNKGKYDPMEVQNVINDLRDESRFNIHSLEKEITIIQQSLQNSDFYPPQSTSGESFDDCAAIPVPTLRAVFAGYKVTNYDRMRLASAHPEDHSR